MQLPDYKGRSVVNLTSSIMHSFDVKNLYLEAKLLSSKELKSSKNVILLLIDALGYEYLMKYFKNSYYTKNMRGKITSVFPSTTATVTSSFYTGLAPQQHAITGWNMFLKEINTEIMFLPFRTRLGKLDLKKTKFDWDDVLDIPLIDSKIKNYNFVVPSRIIGRNYINKDKNLYGFNTLKGMFSHLKKIVKTSKKRTFIHAYWDTVDTLTHIHGNKSKIVKDHVKEIEIELQKFVKSIEGTNTTLIIVSDHGQIDADKSKNLDFAKHPKLIEMLNAGVSGIGRVGYCYVKPSRVKDFEKYIKKHFSGLCELHKSEDLIKKGYFGLFKPHKKLIDRIGDYTIIMKGQGVIEYPRFSKKKHFKANHGGLSDEEMLIPLIVIKT